MGKYMLCNTEQLDADMKSVADTIRSKGGTTAELAWPGDFKTAVEAISTGVEVKKASGTLSISRGSGTISCGFKPDFISLSSGKSFSGFQSAMGFPFTPANTDKITLAFWADNTSVVDIGASRTSTGASFSAEKWDQNWQSSDYSGSFSYVAIKYT